MAVSQYCQAVHYHSDKVLPDRFKCPRIITPSQINGKICAIQELYYKFYHSATKYLIIAYNPEQVQNQYLSS